MPRWAILLCRQAVAKFLGALGIEAIIDPPGVNELFALATPRGKRRPTCCRRAQNPRAASHVAGTPPPSPNSLFIRSDTGYRESWTRPSSRSYMHARTSLFRRLRSSRWIGNPCRRSSFLSCDLRSKSGSFRKIVAVEIKKSKATSAIFLDRLFGSFCNLRSRSYRMRTGQPPRRR